MADYFVNGDFAVKLKLFSVLTVDSMLLCHSCGHLILDVLRLKQIVSDNYCFVFIFLINILLSAFIQTANLELFKCSINTDTPLLM